MNRQFWIESDVVVEQVFPPVDFAVNECRVHIVIDECELSVRHFRLFDETGCQRVEPDLHFVEDNEQSASVTKHIISIAEHNIICCRTIKTSITSCRYTFMLALIIFYIKRIIILHASDNYPITIG